MYKIEKLTFSKFLDSGATSVVWVTENFTKVLFVEYPVEKHLLWTFQQKTGIILMPGLQKIDNEFMIADYLPHELDEVTTFSQRDFNDYLCDMIDTFEYYNRKRRIPKKYSELNSTLWDGIKFYKFINKYYDYCVTLDANIFNFRADGNGKIYWFDPVML